MVLIEKLDKYMVDVAIKKDEEYQKTALSPTDAYGCPRKIFYKWYKYDCEPTNAQNLRVFSMGNAIHERWQSLLQEMGIQLKDEFYIDDTYKGVPIHGYVDSICLIDNTPVIVELKSQKDWMYGKIDYLKEAKKEHIGQVMIYMHFTGIHTSILLYENKNTSELKEFIVKYDKEKALEILNSFVETYELINLNELPERFEGAKKEKYPCSWCPFVSTCFDSLENSNTNLNKKVD